MSQILSKFQFASGTQPHPGPHWGVHDVSGLSNCLETGGGGGYSLAIHSPSPEPLRSHRHLNHRLQLITAVTNGTKIEALCIGNNAPFNNTYGPDGRHDIRPSMQQYRDCARPRVRLVRNISSPGMLGPRDL